MASIVQQRTLLVAGAFSGTITLTNPPAAGALVVSVFSGNKSVPSIVPPTSFTTRAAYQAASVSGAVASASGVNGGTWSWGGTAGTHNNGALGLFETDLRTWAFRSAVTAPSPANDTNVSSISADLGAAPAAGVVFAVVGVDSAYEEIASPWTTGSTVTFTNGYVEFARILQDTNTGGTASGPNAAGVAFIIAKKDVTTGATTSTTVSWSGGTPASIADQAYLHLVEFDGTAGGAVSGAAVAALGALTATVLGRRAAAGSAAALLGALTATAAGTVARTGAAIASLGALAAAAAGTRNVTGAAAASLGALTAAAAGQAERSGSAAAVLGGLAATATGARETTAAAGAALGALTATVAGQLVVTGVAAAPLGALTAVAAAGGQVVGTATANLGALAATADGDVDVPGTAAAPLGSLAASATGGVDVTSAAAATLGTLSASAAGMRAVPGAAAADLGPLAATAAGTGGGGTSATASLGALAASMLGGRDTAGSMAAPLGGLLATSAAERATFASAVASLGGLTVVAVVRPPTMRGSMRPVTREFPAMRAAGAQRAPAMAGAAGTGPTMRGA